MRAVVQRVTDASVSVDGNICGQIKKGAVVLIGVETGDEAKDVAYIAKKIANLRIFDDAEGVMNLNVKDAGGEILAISQFTLLGDARGGNRPSWFNAEKPELANQLYQQVIAELKNTYNLHVEEGVFQAEMLVHINNDGPVTILLESKKLF